MFAKDCEWMDWSRESKLASEVADRTILGPRVVGEKHLEISSGVGCGVPCGVEIKKTGACWLPVVTVCAARSCALTIPPAARAELTESMQSSAALLFEPRFSVRGVCGPVGGSDWALAGCCRA